MVNLYFFVSFFFLLSNYSFGHKYGKTSPKTFPPTGAATPPSCVVRVLLRSLFHFV